MKKWVLLIAMAAVVRGEDAPVTEAASPEVVASAVKAVTDLGKEVVMGKYEAAVDKMYPVWKERMAKRVGGMEKLQEQLDGVAKQMLQQGISITEFKPVGDPIAYEVYPGKIVDEQGVERLRYTKWLVLVPTVTRFRTMIDGDPVAVIIESKGFQVAISEKGTNDWTFIDGSRLTVSDLRSLFITLPETMELPALERKQIR